MSISARRDLGHAEREVKRSRFQPRRPLATGIAIALVALVAIRIGQLSLDRAGEQRAAFEGQTHRVEHVIDGDTLELADGSRVRLIGVDTPETKYSVRSDGQDQPLARDALEFARRAVEGGDVRLQFDVEREDRYGRLLAYAWYTDETSGDELMLNEELIRAGLAKTLLRFPYSESMKRRFRAAEKEARSSMRGLWSGSQAPQ